MELWPGFDPILVEIMWLYRTDCLQISRGRIWKQTNKRNNLFLKRIYDTQKQSGVRLCVLVAPILWDSPRVSWFCGMKHNVRVASLAFHRFFSSPPTRNYVISIQLQIVRSECSLKMIDKSIFIINWMRIVEGDLSCSDTFLFHWLVETFVGIRVSLCPG